MRNLICFVALGLTSTLTLSAKAQAAPYHYLMSTYAYECTSTGDDGVTMRLIDGKGFDQYYSNIAKPGDTDSNGNGTFEYTVKNLDGSLFEVTVRFDGANTNRPGASANLTFSTQLTSSPQSNWGMSDQCVVESDIGKIILTAQLSLDSELDGQ